MKNHLQCIVAFLLLHICAFANEPPVVTITDITQTSNPNELLIIYNLEDADMNVSEIIIRASTDDYFRIIADPGSVSGDIGLNISPGNDKQIIWNYAGQLQPGTAYQIKLIADDHQLTDIQEIVDQVDSVRLLQDLKFLEGIRHRTAGPTHLAEVQDGLYQLFQQKTDETEIIEFNYSNYTAKNIQGDQIGLTDNSEVIYLTAHYDSVHDSPAADDNGTGVAYVMEALRILSEYQFKKTIRYLSFDVEEPGLIGSIHYVQNSLPQEETVIGVLNSDGIGYFDDSPNSQTLPLGFNLLFPDAYAAVAGDDFRGNFIINIGNVEHLPLKEAFDNAAANYVPELRVISLAAPNDCGLVPDLCRSDHAPFWIAGEPAIFLSDGANFRNPYYHTPNDTIGTLNMTFFIQVVKALVGTAVDLAELQHGSFDVMEYDIPLSNEEVECESLINSWVYNQQLNIEWSGCTYSPGMIRLYDPSGKLLLDHVIPNGQEAYSENLSSLSPGIYLIKIQFEEGVVSRKIWKE